MIRFLQKEDLPQVLAIYESGIATGFATFEQQLPSAEAWDAKYDPTLRFVYEEQNEVLGWISITPISTRAAYKGIAELSVYVHPNASGKGIGYALMNHLVAQAKGHGYWMLQGTVFEKNKASIQLHTKAGFRQVGVRKAIAQLHGQWENTVLMERHLLLPHNE